MVEVFGRNFDVKSPLTTITCDAKKDLVYPIVRQGTECAIVELVENIDLATSEEEIAELIRSEALGLRNCREIDQHDNQYSLFVRNETWVQPLREPKVDVFFITGPANCGKSTYANYLLSSLADKHPNQDVYFLDIDNGQPNFTLPG